MSSSHYLKTEKKFFECKSMKQAEELVGNCGDGEVMISIHDPQGMYLKVSDSSQTVFGHNAADLIGNSAYDYFHPEDYQRILQSHAKVTLRPEIDRVNYRVVTSAKETVSLFTLSRQIRQEGGKEFLLAFTTKRE